MTPAAGAQPERGTSNPVEVLDRVLDRGIVIDAEMRLSIAGLTVVGMEARIVVAAIETYLEYADRIALTAPASWHGLPPAEEDPPEPIDPDDGTHNRLIRYFDDDPDTSYGTPEGRR